MADHKSALKRIRQTETRTLRNKDRISRIRTSVKKFNQALGTDAVVAAFVAAQSELQKGVTKGVLHQNTASRKISRMSSKMKAAVAK
jgi:small subunit ribosomal protein S20